MNWLNPLVSCSSRKEKELPEKETSLFSGSLGIAGIVEYVLANIKEDIIDTLDATEAIQVDCDTAFSCSELSNST